MKLLLTSAGITNDIIANALSELVEKSLDEVKTAFILTAKNNRDIPVIEAMANQIKQLDERNINYILVDPSFDSDWREKLDGVELVIIGGGNTFHLLNEARKTGFGGWLKDNLDNKVYMGTSAGSILMTPNIAIASVDDGDENSVGITDLTGLDFVDFELSPHTPEDVSIEGNLAYSKTTPRKLLLLDNNSALRVANDKEIVSTGDWHWAKNGELYKEHVILYSHGFGVEKDDRGLFTDIANSIEGVEHTMFDYNNIDRTNNVLTVTPLHTQADMLKQQYDNLRSKYPSAIIDLVCHSQGCVVAGLAKLDGIRKVVLLAPPTRFLGSEQKLEQMSQREGTVVQDGTVSYPRRDGSTTIIKEDYWQSRDKISDPVNLYNELSKNSQVNIINALNDEVLGQTDYSTLSGDVSLIEQEANHDFTGDSRGKLVGTIKEIILG